MQLFFSYSHKDSNEVQSARIRLLDHNRFNGNVWIDTKKMEVGQDLNRMMYEGIEASSHVVCFLGKSYTESANCMFELRLARTLGKVVIPVVLRPDKEQFPFGSDELADLIPETVLRIQETDSKKVTDKIVKTVEFRTPRNPPSGRRASRANKSMHQGSPGEYEAQDFVHRQNLNDNDLRNIRHVVRRGQGELVNEMLKDNLSLSGRFALIRMANDAPPTPKGSI